MYESKKNYKQRFKKFGKNFMENIEFCKSMLENF